MEDLYDDLDNYHDVNAIQELRSENMELKVKLEEHATAMEKLQKQILQDYDTLEMEFKRLEKNYSSLLKTARAEIERKTQRISQLNIEKDMMVLNSLKNGQRIRRNFDKVQNVTKMNNDKPVKERGNKMVKADDNRTKKYDNKNEKSETTSAQTKEMMPSSSTVNRSSLASKFEKEESSSFRKSNVNENLTYHKAELHDTHKAQAGSIINRRKSLPSVSMPVHDKYSSDEEFENNPTKDTRTDIPPNNKIDRKYMNKIPFDKHCNKTSETSSLDDRGSNHHDNVRETYRGRQTSRNHNNSLYKDKDKYEVSLKYRKHYSPEREQRRQLREYQPDYHRKEHGRYRSVESPPPGSYNHYQRRNQESRSNYDRHIQENEKYRHRYEEKHAGKHRISNEYDEPHTKRQKTEPFGRPQYNEERRYYNDTEARNVQPNLEFSPHDYDALRMSCQSPDYEHYDAAFANPIKEIMATATTPLEDPRVTSKRYVIKKENGKETLSTAVGRNIDIIPLNRAEWKIPSVMVPYALVRRPSQCSDDLVKDIYMDIDNPVANLSLESGEVFESENEYSENRNKKKALSKSSLDHNIKKQTLAVTPMISTNAANISKASSSRYLIPKSGQRNEITQSKMDVPIIDVAETIPNKRNYNEKLPVEDICSQRQNNEHIIAFSNISGNKIERSQAMLSKMTIVADDLELSDENSDNVDSHRQIVTEKVKQPYKMLSSIKEAGKDYASQMQSDSCSLPATDENIDSHSVILKEKGPNNCKVQLNKEGRNEDYDPKVVSDLLNVRTKDDVKSRRHIVKEKVHKVCQVLSNIKETRKEDCKSNVERDTCNMVFNDNVDSNRQMEIEEHRKPSEAQSIKETIQENDTCVESDVINVISHDNEGTPRQMVTDKFKKTPKVQSNQNETKKTDTLSAIENDSCHRITYDDKNTKTADSDVSKSVVLDDKTKEMESTKKQKTKKKKSKSKEVSSKDSVETTETIQVTEKKARSKRDKEDKPKELNNKFSDLFGDSSSLMTPEDLGLPSYLPISEDAQDAVDIKINQIIDAPPPIDNLKISHCKAQNNSKHNRQEETVIDTYSKNVIQKSNLGDTKDVEKNKPSRQVEERIESISPIEIAPSEVYENLNSETVVNEPDVVKTVIISTGMQNNSEEQETVVENHVCKPDVEADIKQKFTTCNPVPAIVEFRRQDIMKALATSTPQKDIPATTSLEADFTCDSNIGNPIESVGEASQVADKTNKLDANDAPDVRIFVKRRRKMVKRPPMT